MTNSSEGVEKKLSKIVDGFKKKTYELTLLEKTMDAVKIKMQSSSHPSDNFKWVWK